MNAPATIPTNYTDAGRLLGVFEVRNAIEALIFGIPLIVIILFASPFGLTATIITAAVIVVPLCGFALIGIRDYSLLTFLRLYYAWRKGRRILSYKERNRIIWQRKRRLKTRKSL